MIDNDKDFFLEATRRICGSLDIGQALWNSFLYIREYIPTDIILAISYDIGLGIGEFISMADDNGGKVTSVKVPVSQECREFLDKNIGYCESHNMTMLLTAERACEHPVFQHLEGVVDDLDCAVMFLGPKPGIVSNGIFMCCYDKKYTAEHLRLFSLLAEPFAIAISNYLRYREVLRLKDILLDDNRYLQAELRHHTGEKIVGVNFGLRQVMESVTQVAPLSSPVLILGETGVGKEVIATAIHNLSPRRNGPLIKVNCGAIPESLMDSELFGHEKGAFTGALYQKRGRFERAHGGTIFLDEIGELTPGVQVRLLRVLQEKEIERVGGSTSIPINIQIITTTHHNLEDMLTDKKFREDLYFRLKVFPIHIPPLRDRRTDIPSLVQHFIRKKSREMGLATVPDIAPGSIEKLWNYNWPGNVREVQNIVERALIVCKNKPFLVFDHLGENYQPAKSTPTTIINEEVLSIDQLLSQHITRVMSLTGGRIAGENGAAKLLGIKPTTLRAKMEKLGIPFGRKAQKTDQSR